MLRWHLYVFDGDGGEARCLRRGQRVEDVLDDEDGGVALGGAFCFQRAFACGGAFGCLSARARGFAFPCRGVGALTFPAEQEFCGGLVQKPIPTPTNCWF